MALKVARHLVIRSPSPIQIASYNGTSKCLSTCSCTKILNPAEKQDEKSGAIARRRIIVNLLRSASLPAQNVRHFHHQNIIQFHIQPGHGGGILFDALQNVAKTRVRVNSVGRDIREHYFQVPDELKRLKCGSLKWLFQFWPAGGKKNYSALTTIKSALQVEDEDARKVVSKSQRLRSATEQQLFDVLDYLKGRNIAIKRLVRLPWLLSTDPIVLEESVQRVKKLLNLTNFKVAISFVNVNDVKLREVAFLWRIERQQQLLSENGNQTFDNRLDFMANRLNCQSEDVADMMAKSNNLMTTPLENINDILTCLLEAGVKPEAIISDPWVFSYNVQSIRSRTLTLTENEIKDFKPWVFRSPQRMFEKFITKKLEKKELLGRHKDIRGFLHEKLNCTEAQAAGILKRVPSLKKATVIKLHEMIEFLFSAGYTPGQIMETPRILAHSVVTISNRWQELNAYNTTVKSLQVLCRTSKDYRAILRKMKSDAQASYSASISTAPEPKSRPRNKIIEITK